MDFEDMVTTFTMPRLCECETEEEFIENFEDSICDHQYKLPLWMLCSNGGNGDDVEDYTLKVTSFDDDEVTGIFGFAFTETHTEGCRTNEWTTPQTGQFRFTFDRATGETKLWNGTPRREYEREEF